MIHTAELRWFVAGALPESMSHWFWDGRRARPADQRQDRYLVLPGCDAVGVKLRSGTSLDIKGRVGEGAAVSFRPGVAGSMERWVKWSCDGAGVAAGLGEAGTAEREWLAVRKERSLRIYSLDAAEPMELASYAGARSGFHVELTRLVVGETTTVDAWTLGFEAYGIRDRLADALETAVDFFFLDRPGPPEPLERDVSMGYPGWLNRLPDLGAGASFA